MKQCVSRDMAEQPMARTSLDGDEEEANLLEEDDQERSENDDLAGGQYRPGLNSVRYDASELTNGHNDAMPSLPDKRYQHQQAPSSHQRRPNSFYEPHVPRFESQRLHSANNRLAGGYAYLGTDSIYSHPKHYLVQSGAPYHGSHPFGTSQFHNEIIRYEQPYGLINGMYG
jgi:hypothetical protein